MSELKTMLTYYKAGETVEIIAMVQGSEGYTEKAYSLTLGSQNVFGDDATNNENGNSSAPKQEQNPYGSDYYSNPFSSMWPFGY